MKTRISEFQFQKKSATSTIAATLLVASIVSILGCLVSMDILLGTGVLLSQGVLYQPNEYLALARSRVETGDELEQAVQALSDAWYHGVCYEYDDFREDIFLYGTHDRGATVIVVSFVSDNSRFVVSSVSTADESTWRSYEQCLPPGFAEN